MPTDPRGSVGTALRPEDVATIWYGKAKLADVLAWSLFCIAIAFQLVIAWRFRALTWDDSAITLGFSRTFAMTGRIEPTPGSGIVEGYSTTLWMLLMAAVAKVVSSSQALLFVAKTASLSLNIANLFVMRAWLGTWMPRMLATLIAGICGCSFMHYETINGMETPLLLALILTMLLLRRPGYDGRRWIYLATGIAVLLTRWEAVWLLIPFVLVERTLRKTLVFTSVWASAFAIMTVIRKLYFGDFLPNTIIAKHGAPYVTGTSYEQLMQHIVQPWFIASYPVYFAGIVLLYVLVTGPLRRRQPRERMPCEFRFSILFVTFSVVLTVGIGFNWGPPLRSFYAAWPFLIALLLFPLAKDWTAPELRRFMLIAVAALSLLTLVRVGRIVHGLRSADAPTYMPDATVSKVRILSDALGEIQEAIGKRDLLYASPDLGAVLLFSQGIRVIDLGLLCNRTLAHERYGAIETYVLQQQRPDVIEVHSTWTSLTGLGSSKRFHDDYRPVIVNSRRMFLRRSVIASIAPARLKELRFVPGVDGSIFSATKGFDPADVALSSSFGTYLLLE